MNNTFTYRMGAGFPGDVNRTHPVSIEPCTVSASNPPDAYGQGVVLDSTTGTVKKITNESGTQALYGITVRPYPAQQTTTSSFCGAVDGNIAPPTTGVVDVLRTGYITVALNTGASGATYRGQAVYVCNSATTGHVVGVFENNTSTSAAILVSNAIFNSASDASVDHITEIAFNV